MSRGHTSSVCPLTGRLVHAGMVWQVSLPSVQQQATVLNRLLPSAQNLTGQAVRYRRARASADSFIRAEGTYDAVVIEGSIAATAWGFCSATRESRTAPAGLK